MDLWLILVLYFRGLALMVAEAFLPGLVVGLIGTAALAVAIVFGFRHETALGLGQLLLALGVAPTAVYLGLRRLSLRTTLAGSSSFAADYGALVGREGEALTDLRPSGIASVDGRRIDVVADGKSVDKGRRVRIARVEGNRVIVKAIQGGS